MQCRFYNHGICKYQESCKYSHKKIADVTSLKSKLDASAKECNQLKLIIEDVKSELHATQREIQKLKVSNIEDVKSVKEELEATKNEVNTLKKHHNAWFQAQNSQTELINSLISQHQAFEKQCTVMKDDLNHFHQEMLDIMKNQVNKCSRMHGDVKRKNDKNEDVIEEELPSKKNKNDDSHEERMNKRTERHVRAIRENQTLEFVEIEIGKIHEFVSREKMFPKKINETKQKLKTLAEQTKKRIGTNKHETIVFGIFERMIQDINKINLNFKSCTLDHIEGFVKICQTEKEKGINIEKEIMESEKQWLNLNQ